MGILNRSTWFVVGSAGGLAVLIVASTVTCSSVPSDGILYCEPSAVFPIPECLDAGTDADASPDVSDDGGGGSSARNVCPGRCVPDPKGKTAGLWSDKIVSLYVGPPSDLPKNCPEEAGVPSMKFRLFDKLVAPPAECDPCECGASEGACTLLPATIEIRAGLCGQAGVSSLPFNGPAGWNGSCSNEGALPAGQLCNGVPCAQSVWSPPLPGPTTESCTPKSATPTTTIQAAKWEMGALACYGNTRDDECNDASRFCLNDPGPSWLFCVYSESENAPACPDNFNYARYTMYPEQPLDDRGCEACSCGDPVGSGCYGTVPLYSDGACSSFITNLLVSSNIEGCQNIAPPGIALGSKKVNPLGYMAGTCAASGGAPKGSAKANKIHSVTFCCTSLFDDIEPPK